MTSIRKAPMAPLVLVTGTGTGVGKTHVSCALIRALRGHFQVLGVKPVESGVRPGTKSDARRLREASGPHTPTWASPYAFRLPISPHLAARAVSQRISIRRIELSLAELRHDTECLLVELAGGLFSPLSRGATNATLIQALGPDVVLCVAPDRLGVLHDVGALERAAFAEHTRIDGIVLSSPVRRDGSTGTNAAELRRFSTLPVLASLPRAPVRALARAPEMQGLTRWISRQLRLGKR